MLCRALVLIHLKIGKRPLSHDPQNTSQVRRICRLGRRTPSPLLRREQGTVGLNNSIHVLRLQRTSSHIRKCRDSIASIAEMLSSLRRGQGPPSLPANYRRALGFFWHSSTVPRFCRLEHESFGTRLPCHSSRSLRGTGGRARSGRDGSERSGASSRGAGSERWGAGSERWGTGSDRCGAGSERWGAGSER
ncbi:hypothetical protein BH18ACI4_BH18ACI4_15460 [soil metagenome]